MGLEPGRVLVSLKSKWKEHKKSLLSDHEIICNYHYNNLVWDGWQTWTKSFQKTAAAQKWWMPKLC